MLKWARLILTFSIFFAMATAATVAFAEDELLNPELIGTLLSTFGVPGSIAGAIVIGFSVLRGIFATLSMHIPDKTLGKHAGWINRLGGNAKHAVNGALVLCLIGLAGNSIACSTEARVEFEKRTHKVCQQIRELQAVGENAPELIPQDETRYALGLTYRQAVNFCDERDRAIEEGLGVSEEDILRLEREGTDNPPDV